MSGEISPQQFIYVKWPRNIPDHSQENRHWMYNEPTAVCYNGVERKENHDKPQTVGLGL
jgi:hypothetical protein